jgi:hypothetical protein
LRAFGAATETAAQRLARRAERLDLTFLKPQARAYFPWNTGLRFSMKARRPSA